MTPEECALCVYRADRDRLAGEVRELLRERVMYAQQIARLQTSRAQLWRILGRPDGHGLDIELADAVADAVGARDRFQSETAHLREVVRFTTEHMAAVHAALDLSYEADTETVLASIAQLRDDAPLSRRGEPQSDEQAEIVREQA